MKDNYNIVNTADNSQKKNHHGFDFIIFNEKKNDFTGQKFRIMSALKTISGEAREDINTASATLEDVEMATSNSFDLGPVKSSEGILNTEPDEINTTGTSAAEKESRETHVDETSQDEVEFRKSCSSSKKEKTSSRDANIPLNNLLDLMDLIPSFFNNRSVGVNDDLNEVCETPMRFQHRAQNKKSKKRSDDTISVRKSSILNEILWWCCGVDPQILRKYPTDFAKHAGVGGTILFTALMASLSSGYALYKVFENIPISVIFGMFWGSMIFNLDRYIVSSIGSSGDLKLVDKVVGISARLLIAVMMGIVISTPLELRLFKSEISVEINKRNNELIDSTQEMNCSYEKKKIEGLENEISRMNAELNEDEKKYENLCQIAITELSGKSVTQKPGPGSVYKEKHKVAVQCSLSLASKKRIFYNTEKNLRSEIKSLETRIQSRTLEAASAIDNNNKILASMVALSRLSKDNPPIRYAKWFISLLIIFIEISPFLFKLITPHGEYEMEIARRRKTTALTEAQRVYKLEKTKQTNCGIVEYQNEKRLAATKSAVDKLSVCAEKIQKKIAEHAVEAWES